jgi:SAM-dependent methyltransferase
MPKIEWSTVRAGRDQAVANLKPILKQPLIASTIDLINTVVKEGDLLLDVGANNRNLEKALQAPGQRVEYYSYDIDRSLPHDYYNLSEITRQFDVITILEVIEHIPPGDVAKLFQRAAELLKPGGNIIVSTPNVCHPVRFWRDCTHITPFRYDELAGLLYTAGFTGIEIFRLRKMRLKDWLRYWVSLPTLRLLDIDFAPGIVVRAKLPGKQVS